MPKKRIQWQWWGDVVPIQRETTAKSKSRVQTDQSLVPTEYGLHIICFKCHPRNGQNKLDATKYVNKGDLPCLQQYQYVAGSKTDYDYAIAGAGIFDKTEIVSFST